MAERNLSAEVAALEAYRRGLQTGVLHVMGADSEVDSLGAVTSQLDEGVQQLLRVVARCAWARGAIEGLKDAIDPTFRWKNPRFRDAVGAGAHYAKLEKMQVVNPEG